MRSGRGGAKELIINSNEVRNDREIVSDTAQEVERENRPS